MSEIPKSYLLNFRSCLVRMSGIEPPRSLDHGLLRPARLPIPPHPQCERLSIYEPIRASVKKLKIQLVL